MEWMAEILFLFVVCLCVCLCTADRSVIAPKWLKLRTSNLTCFFAATVRTRPLKIFRKGGMACDPLNFWELNANSSRTVTAMDYFIINWWSHKNAFRLLFCKNSVGRYMHSHDHILAFSAVRRSLVSDSRKLQTSTQQLPFVVAFVFKKLTWKYIAVANPVLEISIAILVTVTERYCQ